MNPRNAYQIKKDAKKIYGLSKKYRTLEELSEVLGLSIAQIKKSMKTEDIAGVVIANLAINNIVGNNFYLPGVTFDENNFYICATAIQGKSIAVLLPENQILYNDEEVLVQEGDIIYEVHKTGKNIILTQSIIVELCFNKNRERAEAKAKIQKQLQFNSKTDYMNLELEGIEKAVLIRYFRAN